MFRRYHLAAASLCGVMMMGVSADALAGSKNVTPNRFGECQSSADGCRGVVTDEQGFRDFARELGIATSIYALQPAETTGQRGFSVQLNMTNTSILNDQAYWTKASVDRDPPSSYSVMNLHVRKGLPMSFEVGLNAGIVQGTDLVTIGGEVKYALHEDWLWPVPDVAIRAWGNAVLGHRDLDIYNFGGDVIVSVPFGIGGTVQFTPIVGYSLHAVLSRTGVLDAAPGNPMPPIKDLHEPQFVFGNSTQLVHRMFAGAQLSIAVVDLTFQASFIGDQLTLAGGIGLGF